MKPTSRKRKPSAVVIRPLRPGESPPDVEPRRYMSAQGYVRLRWRVGPGEWVECYEHRWVVGCFDPNLHVHHKNGVKDDNRPENLEVVTPAEHAAEHAKADLDEIARLYRSGMSTPEVGAAVGMNAASVYRALIRAGVEPRSLSESQRVHLPEDEVRRLHEAGVSSRMIADHLGVSPSLIQARIKEMGLTPHRPGRQSAEQVARARAALEVVT